MNRLMVGIAALAIWIPNLVFAGPTTAPAADVAVYSFSPIGTPAVPAWLATAVQVNLLTDLARFHFRPVEGPLNSDDSHAAQADAQSRAAAYLIVGNYQSADGTLRITAQILDAQNGAVVGGLNVTGELRDLYALEDGLSNQAVRQLRQLLHPAAATPPQPQPQPLAVAPTAAAQTDSYNGSALQMYANSNRAPSNDYWDQYNASLQRQMY